MIKIIDSENNIIYTGVDAKSVMKVLNKPPEDVTEEDEIRYGELLYSLNWIGELKLQKDIFIKFRGIDDFNRPIFKDIKSPAHFGCVNKLYSGGTKPKEIIEYFKENSSSLLYFGNRFNCEPEGTKSDILNFIIVEK